jgi:hypothetical protein
LCDALFAKGCLALGALYGIHENLQADVALKIVIDFTAIVDFAFSCKTVPVNDLSGR